jgi:general secretion pathway protein I
VSRLATGTPRGEAGWGPERGFTLLEVVVAMAILAMGLMAISDLVGGALRNQVRATHLEVATLLARGKLVALQDEFERKGFRDFDEESEGDFEDEGHREVHWKAQVVKPQVDLGPERIAQMLGGAGGGSLGALLGQGVQAGQTGAAAGKASGDPTQVAMAAALNQQLTQIGEQIKKGVREVRLTVSWSEGGDRTESFTVVTHMAVLAPKEGL